MKDDLNWSKVSFKEASSSSSNNAAAAMAASANSQANGPNWLKEKLASMDTNNQLYGVCIKSILN